MWSASAVLNPPLGLLIQDRTVEIINVVCLSSMGKKKNAADMSGTRGDERRAASENRGRDDREKNGWVE